ncbi:MAG: nucleotidyltransferase domain-containing protein [Bacteroidota bacterium]|nr:nucleotidyltransferase domain-containing protein [Bacteroidota bacterium]
MAERKIIKAKEIIKEYFKLNNLNLKKIILFGSHSTGSSNRNSDIDLAVISPDFKNKNLFEKAKITGDLDWELVKKTDLPFDILYYSDEEWNNSNSLILFEAKKNGRIIFGNK